MTKNKQGRAHERNIHHNRKRDISLIVLFMDILIYLVALFLGIVNRFGFTEVHYLLLHYSNGLYLIVLFLSGSSYVGIYLNDSRAHEEPDSSASGQNSSCIQRGYYRLGHDLIDQISVVFRNHVIVFIILVIILFLAQATALLSRRIIVVTFVCSFFLDTIMREIIRNIFQQFTEKRTKTVSVNGKILRIIPDSEQLEQEKCNGANITHVFVIGCKGIPAEYGGFESFTHNLTKYKESDDILYHVARMAEDEMRYEYHRSIVFDVHVPSLGKAKAVYYDLAALRKSIRYCKKNNIDREHGYSPAFFIMACRIGPFIKHYSNSIHRLGGRLFINPDGHEWKRSKWSKPIQRYWKYSEELMVKAADLIICDSKSIESYINREYSRYNPKTTYIAYGAKVIAPSDKDISNDTLAYRDWCRYYGIKANGYYLMVGRFVPENNYETVISEFMKSGTKRDLVIVTTQNEKFSAYLEDHLNCSSDPRIKFVGTVYNVGILREIRCNAYAYIHGHEVGGTNPSLLESLGATDLNLLFDVDFNHEVGADSCLYFNKMPGMLAALIDRIDGISATERAEYGRKAKARIEDNYSWHKIVTEYEAVWMQS